MNYKILFTSALLLLFTSVRAQTDTLATDSIANDAPRVFVDCSFCDIDYIRQNIGWINYVRDRKLADVHVLGIRQSTGSGGNEFMFEFIGQGRFVGMNDTLIFVSDPTNTSDELREGRKTILTRGLLPYAMHTSVVEKMTVSFDVDGESEPEEVEDKWNNWVFSINAGAWFNGQESYQSFSGWSSINVDRITPEWKIELGISANYSENTYDLGDEVLTNVQRSQYWESRIARSISDHWSVGGFANANSSLFNNYKLFAAVYPGIEYNVYPYSESSKHQLRITYHAGMEQRYYNDSTIYNLLEERLAGNQFSVAYKVQDKWGSVTSSITGTAYFHDFNQNSLRFWSSVNLRLFKGFSFRCSGNISLIRNQLNIVKGNASDADILLRQRNIASSYNYWGDAGFTYTFGSIYNSVVNPRFGS